MKKRKKISFKKILSEKIPKKQKPEKKETLKEEIVSKEKPSGEKEKKETKYYSEQKEVVSKSEEKKPLKTKIKKEKVSRKREELMIVRVVGEFYGIYLSCVEEIKRELKLTSTPNRSEFLSGIAEIRDSIVPVVNLASLFGLEQESVKPKKIPVVTIKIANQIIGFEVSEIVEITEIKKNEILPLPDIFPPHLFSGGYTYKSYIVGILNVESLLKGKQIQSFKEKINEVIK